MSHKVIRPMTTQPKHEITDLYFHSETKEIPYISSMAFLKAGEKKYPTEQFYWQNADDTLTIAGVGHAYVLKNHETDTRYESIAKQWKQLTNQLDNQKQSISPMLFGGFSFDPIDERSSEWDQFPSAYFVVPRHQLIQKDQKMFLLTNVIGENEEHIKSSISEAITERDFILEQASEIDVCLEDKPKIGTIHEIEKEQYKDAVQHTTEQIKQGKADKVVIARNVNVQFEQEVHPMSIMQHIINEQPNSYRFGLMNNGQLFFGATPERLVEVKDGRAYSACVAGSIKRGSTDQEDAQLGAELLNDSKNRGEHQYVVEMISEVFNAYCEDVQIPNCPSLLKIRDIQHLFTPVEANVKAQQTIFEFVKSLHPTPALGGVPTSDALEIIRNQEQMNRGFYAGPIGWVDANGNGEFAVAIRSGLLSKKEAYLYAGGGIVADSEVQSEYEETWVKFRPVLRALGGQIDDK